MWFTDTGKHKKFGTVTGVDFSSAASHEHLGSGTALLSSAAAELSHLAPTFSWKSGCICQGEREKGQVIETGESVE